MKQTAGGMGAEIERAIRTKLRDRRAHKAQRDRRKAVGQCIACGRQAITQRRCLRCLLRKMSDVYLGTSTRYRELARLFCLQSGRCFYSGRVLRIGDNAGIDHILPVSRYPSKRYDVNNLVWVDRQLNLMKTDMTLTEFLDTCEEVLEWNNGERPRK